MGALSARWSVLLAMIAGVVAAACDDGTAPASGPPTSLAIVAGDSQFGPVGEPLATNVAVRVTDDAGHPVFLSVVWFETLVGSGQVSPLVAQTDENGLATGSWVMGRVVGVHRVRVSLVDDPTVFANLSATAVAGPAAHLFEVIGIGQSGDPGEVLASPLVARVTDQYFNSAPDVVVTWRVVTGNGTLSDTVTVTDENGIAAVYWTLGTEVTGIPDTVFAEVPDVSGSPAVFTALVRQPPP